MLADEGYAASSVESGEECLDLLRKTAFDVVLLDIWLPGIDGLETLERIRELDNPPEVIMISGHGTIETAVRATKLGAYDFLEKPLSLDKTLILVKNAIESKKLRRENVDLKKQLVVKSVIVGDSIPMKALRQQIGLMAPTNGRVLISASPARARNWWPTPSTARACARTKLSSRSTAPPSRKI